MGIGRLCLAGAFILASSGAYLYCDKHRLHEFLLMVSSPVGNLDCIQPCGLPWLSDGCSCTHAQSSRPQGAVRPPPECLDGSCGSQRPGCCTVFGGRMDLWVLSQPQGRHCATRLCDAAGAGCVRLLVQAVRRWVAVVLDALPKHPGLRFNAGPSIFKDCPPLKDSDRMQGLPFQRDASSLLPRTPSGMPHALTGAARPHRLLAHVRRRVHALGGAHVPVHDHASRQRGPVRLHHGHAGGSVGWQVASCWVACVLRSPLPAFVPCLSRLPLCHVRGGCACCCAMSRVAALVTRARVRVVRASALLACTQPSPGTRSDGCWLSAVASMSASLGWL